MANCHEQFTDFNETITLSDTRKKSLKRSRKKLRDRIRDDFKANRPKEVKPKFHSQGSFEMGTGVNPIPRTSTKNGESKTLYKYDVDDGIYFIGEEGDRKSITTYHNWIYDAVDGHTDTPPIDKNTCIRTVFADGHNIDKPIYFKLNEDDSIPQLAHKSKGWIDSDPREFSNWFNEIADENPQLRRIVKYLKAWSDYQNFISGTSKMPSGLVMTIWAAEHASYGSRDDISMNDTLQNIKNFLDEEFVCRRPTTPKDEDILDSYKYKDYFMERLADFLESATQAIKETNHKDSCLKWQSQLGSRFSCASAKDEDEGARSFASPAIVTNNAKSA